MPYTVPLDTLVDKGTEAYRQCLRRVEARLLTNTKKSQKIRETYAARRLYYGAFVAKELIEREDKALRRKGKKDPITVYCFILGVYRGYVQQTVRDCLALDKSTSNGYKKIVSEVETMEEAIQAEEERIGEWMEELSPEALQAADTTVDKTYAAWNADLMKERIRLGARDRIKSSQYSDLVNTARKNMEELAGEDANLGRLSYCAGDGAIAATVNLNELDSGVTAIVNDFASVEDEVTLGGKPKIKDQARVTQRATVEGDSTVAGEALVTGDALVTDDSYVGDDAIVGGFSRLYNRSEAGGRARLFGAILYDTVFVGGDAILGECKIYGNTVVGGTAEIDAGAIILGGTWDGSEGPVYGGVWRGPNDPA